MNSLSEHVVVKGTYTRSINIQRDRDSIELVEAYLPTQKSVLCLEQIAGLLASGDKDRGLALIGPYGAGKSAFALFLSALLGAGGGQAQKVALAKVSKAAPDIAPAFKKASRNRGFLRVVINGTPDSLSRQMVLALTRTCESEDMDGRLLAKLRKAAKATPAMSDVMALVEEVRATWADSGGSGVLLEIDELGKFLEFEANNPFHREMHLLQLLAETSRKTESGPLLVVVMLHQAFEYYASRVGLDLRNEWQKVQGRYSTVAFIESLEQSTKVMSAAFQCDIGLPNATRQHFGAVAAVLATEGVLANAEDADDPNSIFEGCYPLHPLTTLILPALCQKVAQNERTLFSYLGSSEPHGFTGRLKSLTLGEWIEPHELYDYFIENQSGVFSDPLTYHRWVEVVSALERFDASEGDPAVRLLKTIGLLNLLGGQRGLKASPSILATLFGAELDELLKRLEQASIVHYRTYNNEYRVWQGTDFDLGAALRRSVEERSDLSLADTLNELAPIRPIVARRASISSGSLRSFTPKFVDRKSFKNTDLEVVDLTLWFYLATENESLPSFDGLNNKAVIAVCSFTETLRDAVVTLLALQDLPKTHAALEHDPVAQREYRLWLANAEATARGLFRVLMDRPEALTWYWAGQQDSVLGRRDLQKRLSDWVDNYCFTATPLIRNELINWDYPSASANSARKKLLAAMLESAHLPALGISKTPAEMSIYLSVLWVTGIHREEDGRLGIYPPRAEADPANLAEIWGAIEQTLGAAGERQVPLTEVYRRLQGRPFGVKLGLLPILLVAYLLTARREVALYQEGAFCDSLTIDMVEMLCRRPELFSLERFELSGIRGDIFNKYISSVVGNVRKDATLLDIVRPLMRFVAALPAYTRQSKTLPREVIRVRDAFNEAKSPGALLFNELPDACGVTPDALINGDARAVEAFMDKLVQCLRELKTVYPTMLKAWQDKISDALLGVRIEDLARMRSQLAERYGDLDRYTPDQKGAGAFVKRLSDQSFATDEMWLESLGTLLGRVPPQKWSEENRLHAELRLEELSQQLKDLQELRDAVPGAKGVRRGVLVKMVDAQRGEIGRVLQLTDKQWGVAKASAEKLARSLDHLTGSDEKLAVVAMLLEQIQGGARDRNANDER
jgi:hypothetical protein